MDMESLHRAVYAAREAKGLVSACGVACATQAEKAYRDFRHEMKQRADWPDLPPELRDRLESLYATYKGRK